MKRFSKICTILSFSLIFLLCFCAITQTSASSFIDTQIVDSVGEQGTQSSLALDSRGNPHISYTYLNMTETNLMYASWTGSKFIFQTVDTNGAANPSLALDSESNPHISYTCTNNTGTYLMYAHWAGSEWIRNLIASAQNGSGISDPSLKLDNKDIPHVAYVDAASTLEYAVWTGSAWNKETIDPWTEQVANPSLALDPDGKPWISYYDTIDGLKCVSWTGSGWNKMTIDSAKGVGRESSLAIDIFGNPHASYDDEPNGNLKYAGWTGSNWTLQIVDKNKHVSFYSSLAMDSYANPHISYLDNANGNLIYATWNGSIWNSQIVDQIRVAPGDLDIVWGFPTSLALDSTGTAHISYCGYTRHDLKYASVSDSPSFLVTFKLTGVQDFEGKTLEVDSVDFRASDLPKSFAWRAGSSHSYEFASPLNLVSGGRLNWVSTSGLSNQQSGSLTVSKEGTLTAMYAASEETSKQDIPPNSIIGSLLVVAAIIAIAAVLVIRRKKLKKIP